MMKQERKKRWQWYKDCPTNERDIVIGFDFGTSCTKIIIRDFQRKEAFAIPFNDINGESNRYLLPTKVYINSDGSLCLDSGDNGIDALKVQFIQNPTAKLFENKNNGAITATSLDLTVAYIGFVLIHARNWFNVNKCIEYQNFHINWQVNIGMPSRSYDDADLCSMMKRAALAGWNLSLLNDDCFSLSDIKKAIEISDLQIKENDFNIEQEQLHPDYVNPVPEIIAEVIGYFRSPMRKDGMYLIVDVGARTLDVSTFIVYENEELGYSILTAEVEILGAFVLHQNRIDICKKIIEKRLFNLISICDGISPLPEAKKYLPEPTDEDEQDLEKNDEQFSCECSRMIRGVIKETKDRRNPLSQVWEKGFPVFLCGGGAQINLYQQLLEDVQQRLKSTKKYQIAFIKKEFPVPTDIKNADINSHSFNRLAVAYGLSFPKYDIGEIIPPDKTKDLECKIEIRDIDRFYVDKDMV